MACISPIQIKQKGIRHIVPCGRCVFCLEEKRNQWSFRLQKELRYSKTACFLTITYEEENLPLVDYYGSVLPSLHKPDHQKFMKRLRKRQTQIDHKKGNFHYERKVSKSGLSYQSIVYDGDPIRYFMTGEYGSKMHRPHYHYILFNLYNEVLSKIEETWKGGFIKVGTVTDASIHYVTKYLITDHHHEDDDPRVKPFSEMSRNPGLGDCYLKDNYRLHKRNLLMNVRDGNGYLHKIPKFYKDKIFNRFEKDLSKGEIINYADRRNMQLEERLKRKNHDMAVEMAKIMINEEKIEKKLKFQTKSDKL